MSDLISRRKLDGMRLVVPDFLKPDERTRGWNECITYIQQHAPAVDAEPVRHGRWIPLWKSLFDIKGFRCSECGYIAKGVGYAYCHCGAKMDGGTK